jgi:hypothetical protein
LIEVVVRRAYTGRVEVRVLTNAEGTKQNIEAALAWLRQQPVRPRDYVVVFVAGHGAR